MSWPTSDQPGEEGRPSDAGETTGRSARSDCDSSVWSTDGKGQLVSQSPFVARSQLAAPIQEVSSPVITQSDLPTSRYREVDWPSHSAGPREPRPTKRYVAYDPLRELKFRYARTSGVCLGPDAAVQHSQDVATRTMHGA